MGDDLTFARDFTATASEGLDLVLSLEDLSAPDALRIVTDMTTRIQRGAKRLRARHLYQAAQGVFAALDAPSDMDDRLHNLSSLLKCYETGLQELEAAGAQTQDDTNLVALPDSHAARHAAAKETLEGLLTLAPPADADALSRLMRAPISPEIADAPAPILSFPNDTVPETSAPALPVAAEPIATRTKLPDEPLWALDGLMRDVVSDALSVARQCGKTISVSYDMGDASVRESAMTDIRARLGQGLSAIIREQLPEGRMGHLDVNLAGETLHVVARGCTALRIPLRKPEAISASEPAGTPPPAARRMITEDTESDLRDQLSRLMEGGL